VIPIVSDNFQFIASFLVLSISGLVNAGFLVWKHYQKKPFVCPLDHDCSVVTESKWSRIFLVRNEVIGLLFFLGLIVGTLASLFNANWATLIFTVFPFATAASFLFSLFLVFIQFKVIKDYCFYCLISAGITLLVFLNSLLLL